MTIDEIISRKEDQIFDCKSIQIDPKALAVPIVAMANADGGVLAIGVSDKTRRIEGINVKEFGEGIDRICNELESRGAVVPTFHTDAFILKATLKAEFVDEDTSATATIGETIGEMTGEMKLTNRQAVIYNEIKCNPSHTAKSLARQTNISTRTVEREISFLRNNGFIEKKDKANNSDWVILK